MHQIQMMNFRSSEQQILKLFQSLFSRDQLRKNLYVYQHLQPNMTLKTKVIYNERKVASISKDQSIILECLRKCPLVQVLDEQTLHLKAGGDALIVSIESETAKSVSEVRKIVTPLLKDIKNEVKQNDGAIEIQFQSETSVAEFLERLKSKGAPLSWKLKQKDPYQCIKKSVKFLLKQRKSQQQSNYTPQQYYPQQNYYQPQYSYQAYQGNNYGYNNYQAYQQHYPTFIRKSVDSDEQIGKFSTEQKREDAEGLKRRGDGNVQGVKDAKNVQNRGGDNKVESKSESRNQVKLDIEDFPQL